MRATSNVFGFLVFISMFLLISCASTEFQTVRKDDTYTGGYLKKVLIVGVSKNLKNRVRFEDTFSAQFKKRGVDATPSYKAILSAKNLTKEKVLNKAEELGVDAILVASLLGVKEKYIHYDPSVQRTSKFDVYWTKINAYAHSPVTYTEIEDVRLVTNIFERKTEKLIWTGVTKTVHPKSLHEAIDSLCGAILSNMSENKLIR